MNREEQEMDEKRGNFRRSPRPRWTEEPQIPKEMYQRFKREIEQERQERLARQALEKEKDDKPEKEG